VLYQLSYVGNRPTLAGSGGESPSPRRDRRELDDEAVALVVGLKNLLTVGPLQTRKFQEVTAVSKSGGNVKLKGRDHCRVNR
jgi:hypothetical protein